MMQMTENDWEPATYQIQMHLDDQIFGHKSGTGVHESVGWNVNIIGLAN